MILKHQTPSSHTHKRAQKWLGLEKAKNYDDVNIIFRILFTFIFYALIASKRRGEIKFAENCFSPRQIIASGCVVQKEGAFWAWGAHDGNRASSFAIFEECREICGKSMQINERLFCNINIMNILSANYHSKYLTNFTFFSFQQWWIPPGSRQRPAQNDSSAVPATSSGFPWFTVRPATVPKSER